ncbi:recombinase family protein [Nonomuraea dietziae]|uniref:recombinase family protein n=1 Tax=Nonomuraea dietziae TaxID=65515 RepID=UPI0033F92930
MSKMFFNMLALFAAFEADLLKMRTREGMAIARSRGRLKGRAPKPTARQRAELVRMHATGDYTIAELTEVFRRPRHRLPSPRPRSRRNTQPRNGRPATWLTGGSR